MAAEDVHVRLCLQEIIKLDLEVQDAIQNIRDYADSSEELDELNQLARGKLRKLRTKVDELERLGKEQDKPSDRDTVLRTVETHIQRMASTTACLRQVNLATMTKINAQAKQELLSGASKIRKRNLGNRETLAKASTGITESLMSINRLLSTQVVQSGQNIDVLETSSKAVQETHDEFKSMGGHIQTSKHLLTKYGRREFTDKLLIVLAMIFFAFTVIYIVKKRI